MSDQRKTIQFNPELFKISDKGKSQRKRTPKIRVKTPEKPVNNATLKNRYLKYIREKQQQDYDKIFDEKTKKKNSIPPSLDKDENITLSITDIVSQPGETSNFIESVEYLQNIVNENEKKEKLSNKTGSLATESNYFESISPGVFVPINVESYPPIYKEEFDVTATLDSLHTNSNSLNEISREPEMVLTTIPIKYSSAPSPQYGCLKNGNLPTYRNFMNLRSSSAPASSPLHCSPIQVISNDSSSQGLDGFSVAREGKLICSPESNINLSPNTGNPLTPLEKYMESKSQYVEKMKTPTFSSALKTAKRKKTIKRTFNIGRSNVYSRIGVIIKNRTLRNRITTQKQLLKQVDIDDIKRYLIKNGLIKVGTPAPDDVLRQMYESAVMIGGELRNYNVENLLHNYLHP